MKERISKIQYYMNMAEEAAARCTCFRVKIGAIIVKDDQIVATGYVGAPRKTKDCLEHGFCLREKMHIPYGHRYELCRSVHAEQNALINTGRGTGAFLGGDMYIYGHREMPKRPMNAFPCFICKKMIINAGIERVFCTTKEGGIKVFEVQQWINEWQKQDIIDDQHQYGI